MAAVLITVLLCILLAGAVVWVASLAADRTAVADDESSWQAFRRGLATLRRRPAGSAREVEETALAAGQPVDVSLGELLRSAADDGEAYLRPGELTLTLHRARVRVAHAEHRSVRAPRPPDEADRA